ncbi:hypothetical protein BV22DRAFT_44216 [Leucogyrophana mollusca]|uniref:Uncharacterized protein n=1 Tax=Leucogyrophana mollusca TaxID=85980 RepID=A0ACB8C0I6_9AGAM|nr:hypothetical protein BV22DRAFT_44216 [Leucogyrophana mollusca]
MANHALFVSVYLVLLCGIGGTVKGAQPHHDGSSFNDLSAGKSLISPFLYALADRVFHQIVFCYAHKRDMTRALRNGSHCESLLSELPNDIWPRA